MSETMKLQLKNYWGDLAELCCKCIHSRERASYEDTLLICVNSTKYYLDEREDGKCGKDGKLFVPRKTMLIKRRDNENH